jgi:prepilin signal peptidase PulO-like enzyme (type II secretory pathway)
MLSSIMGGACGLLVMLLSGASRKTQIPFGPFLSLSGLTVLFVPLPLGFK